MSKYHWPDAWEGEGEGDGLSLDKADLLLGPLPNSDQEPGMDKDDKNKEL
jgi:hypothetical protein